MKQVTKETYVQESGDIVISRELIQRYQDLVKSHGAGFWWSLSLAEILEGTSYKVGNQTLILYPFPTNLFSKEEDHMREGLDIMDIWLDSGLSWSCVLGQDSTVTDDQMSDVPKADLYIEGLDQFSGWFYTSLLTSLALTGEAPYKKIFVHGFTLDENGNKV